MICNDCIHFEVCGITKVLKTVNKCPYKRINVAEVKHGEWTEEYKEDAAPLFRWRWVCSACGEWNGYGKSKFCPNCGADMRGETK